ncbi:FAD:protein FMN transferase [Brevundimonas sp. Leaf363]|uniref:FAD:protein FMN transferase n=1 Tax=Brevundimonas sp. Leaf363 TaxID=1736353 RepID=UPI000AB0DC52|nr:FAD:protein FMN transferase [Brevundimonas sp. Leaf363]
MPTGDIAPTPPPGDRVVGLDGETMGTTWRVRLVLPTGDEEARLRAAIEEELAGIVAVFSHWDPRSEVSRFNTAPAGVWALSKTFWSLLDQALDIADQTNGAVDPTLGALADLWGFGPAGRRQPPLSPIPSDEEIEAALAVSGWRSLRLNREARGAMQLGGMKLDFSGIAKGHAVDRVSERLTSEGATSHLIEIGGELRGAGVKPDAQPWWVSIEQPDGLEAPRTVAALFDLAVATSGDALNAFEHDGRRYPHTIDGSTGRPIDNGVVSVTVIHASAMVADAWATALSVMGPYEGPPYAEMAEIAAHFVERTSRGLVEHITPAYRAMMDEGD